MVGRLTSALRQRELSEARLRLTVTRGHAHRDPLHGESFRPTCFLTADELPPYPPEFREKGLTAVVSVKLPEPSFESQTKDKLLRGAELAKRTKALAEAEAIHNGFIERLASFRVLDPAYIRPWTRLETLRPRRNALSPAPGLWIHNTPTSYGDRSCVERDSLSAR